MKNKLLLFVILLLSISCTTNYYTVLLTDDTNLYKVSDSSKIVTSIPGNTQVYISSSTNRKKYKKIRWGTYTGWAYNPRYTLYSSYQPTNYSPSNHNSTSNSSTVSPSRSGGGTVHVKGYTRKDGTYVRPHTRSAPRRR